MSHTARLSRLTLGACLGLLLAGCAGSRLVAASPRSRVVSLPVMTAAPFDAAAANRDACGPSG